MEERGYLLLDNGQKEYFPEGIQVLSGYENRQDIVEVYIPNSVFLIDNQAFHLCRNLQKVSCNAEKSSLIHIGWAAFYLCASLQNFQAPKSLRVVGAYAFLGAAFLAIDFSNAAQLAFLGGHAFQACSQLIVVKLPNCAPGHAITISECCFYECENLLSITGGPISNVGLNAFPSNDQLLRIPTINEYATIGEENDSLKALM